MKVWLTRKHAERLDGIDLRAYAVGDTLDLPHREAALLLAESWARPERRRRHRRPASSRRRRATDRR